MIFDYGDGIYGIDARYKREGFVQVYLVKGGGGAALIETAHNGSLPYVLSAMKELGVAPESVRYVCLTHVHLDHAGGAGSYMRELPDAALVVHRRGARHMTDPAELYAAVCAVYGADVTKRLYGDLVPVPASRVIAADDGLALSLGDKKIICLDAPGHAKHHMIFFEEQTRSVFSGDGFGVSFGCMRGVFGQWAVPTSSPVQFDPEAMKETIRRILSLRPKAVYATHCGKIEDIEGTGASLKKSVDEYVKMALAGRGESEATRGLVLSFYRKKIKENGQEAERDKIEKALATDIELDTQGLVCWYRQQSGQGEGGLHDEK